MADNDCTQRILSIPAQECRSPGVSALLRFQKTSEPRLPDLPEVEQRVLQLTIKQLCLGPDEVHLDSRYVQDLGCDSLELIELFCCYEQEFRLEAPIGAEGPLFKSLFTRRACRVRDVAELIFLQQRGGPPVAPRAWFRRQASAAPAQVVQFSQLGGLWRPDDENWPPPFFEFLENHRGSPQYRRRSDGMRCVLLPATRINLGSDDPLAQSDERPLHAVELDAFLIDAEPVSTTAFCRFLNSLDGVTDEHLADWFLLPATDDRREQLQIQQSGSSWVPLPGTECKPMVLVSWFGANAYSLWANQSDWRNFRSGEEGWLPSEAQWEYAAQGVTSQPAPGETEPAFSSPVNCGAHEPGTQYTAASMPLASVHETFGVSVFGLHHMAGNVWQWCRDWYDAEFYSRPESREANPVNCQSTGIRSERGGSWVGPAELCRSSYRRGRVPTARGRCLGFRCISDPGLLGKRSPR